MKNYMAWLGILIALLLSACAEDGFDERRQPSSETPVELFTEYPSWGGMTRSAITIPEKTVFKDGNVIHVQGDFKIGETETVRRYDSYLSRRQVAAQSRGRQHAADLALECHGRNVHRLLCCRHQHRIVG
ncbi:MAG: hypothetical protein UHL07_04140 [Bacteroidaceae bacterium]|nr:hypothetical protein [Bacteroidaceae bacterium]